MTAIEIVSEVLGQQCDRIFSKMDKLTDEHGHFTVMPLPQFQEHCRLSHQAAALGISRDRIVRRLEKEPNNGTTSPNHHQGRDSAS